MRQQQSLENIGLFGPAHHAFLEKVVHLRADLHRYSARMIGSIFDGEDLVQDALFEAYQKLHLFDETRPLRPWLFRIVHNRCVDFLRRRAAREQAESAPDEPLPAPAIQPVGLEVGRAVEHLVIALPPKERACVLLKDVFDYSLEEIASLVDSTVGGVKAALSRGRAKLAALSDQPPLRAVPDARLAEVIDLYLERFNRRDWDGVRELISADARLRVANCFAGRVADSPYFIEYERAPIPWRLVAEQLGEFAVISVLRETSCGWAQSWLIKIEASEGKISDIKDYLDCPWLLSEDMLQSLNARREGEARA